jgi:hypothetical protein
MFVATVCQNRPANTSFSLSTIVASRLRRSLPEETSGRLARFHLSVAGGELKTMVIMITRWLG